MFRDLLGAHSFVASIVFPVFLRGFMFLCKLLINLLFLWKWDKVCEELFGSRQAHEGIDAQDLSPVDKLLRKKNDKK